MAFPLAAIPLLTKAGAKLASLGTAMKGAGTAKSLGMNAAYLGKGKATKMAGGLASKMSGKPAASTAANLADDLGILGRMKRGLTSVEGFKKNLGVPMGREDLMMTVAPDLLFGGLAAATTEGDIVDKALAGLGSAAGGIGGGLGARGVFGPKSGLGILTAEMAGGIGGDMVGMGVADSLIRAKHGGMTPAEQKYGQQDEAYRQQIIDQFLAENGMG